MIILSHQISIIVFDFYYINNLKNIEILSEKRMYAESFIA